MQIKDAKEKLRRMRSTMDDLHMPSHCFITLNPNCIVGKANLEAPNVEDERRVDAWLSGPLFWSHPVSAYPPCLANQVLYNL